MPLALKGSKYIPAPTDGLELLPRAHRAMQTSFLAMQRFACVVYMDLVLGVYSKAFLQDSCSH